MPTPDNDHPSRRSGVRVEVGRESLVSFAGCDYLGLSQDAEVLSALRSGIDDYGGSASASRTTTGTFDEHVALERDLARFFDRPDATLLPDGSLANFAVAEAVRTAVGRDENPFAYDLDAASHPSLAVAFGAGGRRFDRDDITEVVGPVIATDGVFPSAGVVAPLPELLDRLPKPGVLVIDDCHGTGVLGPTGRGSLEHHGVADARTIVTGTLSKALGLLGGFVVGEREWIDTVRRSTAYVTSTPIPPAFARAGRVALDRVGDPELRSRLETNRRRVHEALKALGLATPRDPVPVFAITRDDSAATIQLEASLRREGFLVPFIRYPGGPSDGYLRLAVSAAHDDDSITALITALDETLR